MITDRQQATEQIARDIEREGLDPTRYDAPAIADQLHEVAGTWHLDSLSDGMFWATVAAYAKTPPPVDSLVPATLASIAADWETIADRAHLLTPEHLAQLGTVVHEIAATLTPPTLRVVQ